MKHRACLMLLALIPGALCLQGAVAAAPATATEAHQLAHDIFKQLIEINTTDSVGNITVAAEAMKQRLLDAGFPAADIVIAGPNERKQNMVVRYRGKAATKLRPVLIIAHLDVVEARREDWSTDPFQFVEQDGYYYGRGTQDMKVSDAIVVTDFIRMRKEGFVPDRDIILALTADEEGGKSNGVDWLLNNRKELVDAEYALNPDSGGVVTDQGKALTMEFEATEKLYADYEVTATNPGGHSSLPKPDNAIYRVIDALALLQKTPFPIELNNVSRDYFKQMATIETGRTAADIEAVLANPPDPAAAERLSRDPRYNATLRTTCVPTMMDAGHAPNALPQRAEVNVNCRIVPGHSQEDIRLQLVQLFDDSTLNVSYKSDAGVITGHGSDRRAMAPPPVRADVIGSLRSVTAKFWPGAVVMPIMMTGGSDSVYTMAAGIPSYGICGVAIDRNDVRMHGKDERVSIDAFYKGVDFYHDFLEKLTRGH